MKMNLMKSMKAKKLAIVLCAAIAIAGAGIGTTVSYLTDKDAATNKFTLGKVDITLTEPNYDEEKSKDIMPGDVFVKDPTITNNEEDCYIAVKVSLIKKNDKDEEIGLVQGDGIEKIWNTIKYEYKQDGSTVSEPFNKSKFINDGLDSAEEVFYYNNILKKDSKVVLFNKISIPVEYTNLDFEKMGNYDIKIEVEAIQSANISFGIEDGQYKDLKHLFKSVGEKQDITSSTK